jgi:hypothetical protein
MYLITTPEKSITGSDCLFQQRVGICENERAQIMFLKSSRKANTRNRHISEAPIFHCYLPISFLEYLRVTICRGAFL